MWNSGICQMNHVGNAEEISQNTPCVQYARKPRNTSVKSAVLDLNGCYINAICILMYIKQEIP